MKKMLFMYVLNYLLSNVTKYCCLQYFVGHLINHMKRCHAVTKEPTRVHECSMCSCVYNSLNALNKHLNKYHGLKISNKNVEKNMSKIVETDDINNTANLIKGKMIFSCFISIEKVDCFNHLNLFIWLFMMIFYSITTILYFKH